MKDIYILTGYEGFFGQYRKPWVSINTALFVKELESLGYKAHVHEFHEIANGKVEPRNSIIFYTFSHRLNLRHYIRDCLMQLSFAGNTLVPSFELFCCHENKGWQELMRRQLDLGDLKCHYFSSKREMAGYALTFPLVFKTLTGSSSTGVALVHCQNDVLRELARHEPRLSLAKRLDFWRRKHLRKHKKFQGYPNYDNLLDAVVYQDYMTLEIPFVLQDFIPGLSNDFRVVVLGEHFFVSKRLNRKGDFRASGSQLIEFDVKNPQPLLGYARALHQKLKTPFLSVDFGIDAAGKIHLFEFQASHFGVSTIVRNPGYWAFLNETWCFTAQSVVLEHQFALGLHSFLEG